MNIDDTTLKIIKETRIEVFKKYAVDISEEEIVDIVDSQIRGTVYGLKKGVSIKLPLIGRFLFNDRKHTIEKIVELNKMRDFYSEIEFNQIELEAKIKTIKRNKNRWLKERNTELTVVDLVKKPNISNGKILYDKLSKLIKNGK